VRVKLKNFSPYRRTWELSFKRWTKEYNSFKINMKQFAFKLLGTNREHPDGTPKLGMSFGSP